MNQNLSRSDTVLESSERTGRDEGDIEAGISETLDSIAPSEWIEWVRWGRLW